MRITITAYRSTATLITYILGDLKPIHETIFEMPMVHPSLRKKWAIPCIITMLLVDWRGGT